MKKFLLFLFSFFYFICSIYPQATWTQRATFPGTPGGEGVGFSINTKGYTGTGATGMTTSTDEFWEYDPSGDSWTQKAGVGGGVRQHAVGFSIAGKGYIGVGLDPGGTGEKKDFWEYNPSTDNWVQKTDYAGSGSIGSCAFSIGTNGYIGLGEYGTTFYQDFWEYDTTSNAWTQKANFPGQARAYGFSFSIGSKGYTGGGWNGTTHLSDFWEYDPALDAWTQKGNFPGASREVACAFSILGLGYMGTGDTLHNGTGNLNDFWEYDPGTDAWTQRVNFGGMPVNRASGFFIGNKGYIGTGFDGTMFRQDFWEYTSGTIGINESSPANSNLIYPNPFSIQTTLHSEYQLMKATIEVYNRFGQTVKLIKNISGHTFILSRDNLPAGLYFLRLTNENTIIGTEKLIIID